MASGLSTYEQQREQRIADNKLKLHALGVLEAKEQLQTTFLPQVCPVPKRVRRQAKALQIPCEPRRSGRERPEVNYTEDNGNFHEKISADKAKRLATFLDRADIDLSQFASPRKRSAVDSGKGVRVQGGRVYDSRFGVTCHWCRQKTVEDKVTCTSTACGKGSRLPVSFCKMCLKNRHGEDVQDAEQSGMWICPCCRASCGAGCTACCNCGPCRKKASLQPTGQIIKQVRESGFDNVHDYLVYQHTGETADQIAERKIGFAWGAWLIRALQPAQEDSLAPHQDETLGENGARQRQAALTDSFPVAKHHQQNGAHNGSSKVSSKAERKQRVLLTMGLTTMQTCV